MILLSLSLFLQYDLLQCVEFEKVDFNVLLRAHDQNSSLWNNTPAAYQLDPITPEYAFFTPPDGFHLSPTLYEIPHQTRRSQNIRNTQHKISNNYFKDVFFRHRKRPKKRQRYTVFDTSVKSEERQESQEIASSYNSREHDSHSPKESSSESEQEELVWHISQNSYPSSQEKAADNSESSRIPEFHRTRRPKTVSPAMIRTRRTEETTRHKRKLKPNLLLPMTIIDDRIVDIDKLKMMTPSRSKDEWNLDGNDVVLKRKKPHKDKHEGVGDDNDLFKMMRPGKDKTNKALTLTPPTAEQSLSHDRIADNNADIVKKKTPPRNIHEWNFDDGNDVLMRNKPRTDKHKGMFGDDNEIFKMMTQRKDIRTHVVSDTTKMMWYTDLMIVKPEEEAEHTKTFMPATTKQSLRETPNNDWSRYDESNQEQDTTVSTTIKHRYASSSIEYLRAPLSKNYFFKIMEHRREGYMIVFIIELMQIIASKDKEDAHNIVKHADPIIQRQSKQLLWMGHPFLDVTQRLATMLKVTDITRIQAQAATVFHQLLKRHDTLPAVVNTILEYAETMYNDDEGKVLFDVLRELVTFPKIALTGYWLCNSLINAFLRPFRRLKDTQQLEELMFSINLALKTQNPLRSGQKKPHRSDRGFGVQAGGPALENQPSPQKGSSIPVRPQTITPRPLWKRKSKHHQRHHKRKRDEKQLLRPRYTQGNQGLTLTSVTPRTTIRLRFRDTTYGTYLIM